MMPSSSTLMKRVLRREPQILRQRLGLQLHDLQIEARVHRLLLDIRQRRQACRADRAGARAVAVVSARSGPSGEPDARAPAASPVRRAPPPVPHRHRTPARAPASTCSSCPPAPCGAPVRHRLRPLPSPAAGIARSGPAATATTQALRVSAASRSTSSTSSRRVCSNRRCSMSARIGIVNNARQTEMQAALPFHLGTPGQPADGKARDSAGAAPPPSRPRRCPAC